MKKRSLMISSAFVMCMSAALCFSAPETIVKMSAQFTFPTGVGIIGSNALQTNNAILFNNIRVSGKKIVELSWAFPTAEKTGNISIFSVSGSRVKTFSISSQTGKVEWDITEGKRVAKGVYLATISYGLTKQNLKLVIN